MVTIVIHVPMASTDMLLLNSVHSQHQQHTGEVVYVCVCVRHVCVCGGGGGGGEEYTNSKYTDYMQYPNLVY